jgi:hypothetical protein
MIFVTSSVVALQMFASPVPMVLKMGTKPTLTVAAVFVQVAQQDKIVWRTVTVMILQTIV